MTCSSRLLASSRLDAQLIVYYPVAHWMWGGGWLQQRGALDFAGGIVVHITAGCGALTAAIMLGKRKDFTVHE
jgi:Amt family ammonium transporter